MGKQYNSSADRRWKQRYQRICDQKEYQLDFPSARSKRREEGAKAKRIGLPPLDISRVISGYDAVVCASETQLDTLIRVIKRHYNNNIDVIGFRGDLQFNIKKFVVRVCMDYNWLDCRLVIAVDHFELFSNGSFDSFRLVDYYDLLPVNDLGKVQKSLDSVENLLGL